MTIFDVSSNFNGGLDLVIKNEDEFVVSINKGK